MQPAIATPAITKDFRSRLLTTSLRFKAGQVIFDEGQKATRWYEVVRGTVRTCRFHIDGHRHLTGFYFSGDVFGADYGYYSTAAEAVTDVTVRCYRVGDISETGEPKPDLSEAVSILFRAMSSAQKYLFIMGHRTALEKLAAFLLCIHNQNNDDLHLILPMSRADIADFLGLTIHTVSRTFTELAQRGLIKIEGRHSIVITDKTGLCRLAGEMDNFKHPGGDEPIHPAAEFCFPKNPNPET
ncbi:helix-turn-helix domain-containing protein [Parasphingorhabdus sp.]|uniref:helix-turn-helix domain-containing protein n=1 Tax=Parasphingorhabdus sp. TaxID=2709688 RepID=UPI003A8EDEE7